MMMKYTMFCLLALIFIIGLGAYDQCRAQTAEQLSGDAYKTLDVDRLASDEEITKAYRQLAKRFHPDNKETGSEETMKVINAAYETLRDNREQYDRTCRQAEQMRHNAGNYVDPAGAINPLFGIRYSEVFEGSSSYYERMRLLRSMRPFDESSAVRSWIGQRAAGVFGAPIVMGFRHSSDPGIWIMRSVLGISLFASINPPANSSPYIFAASAAAQLFGLYPIALSTTFRAKGRSGPEQWARWRNGVLAEESTLFGALVAFDIFRPFISSFYAADKPNLLATLLQAQVLRFAEKEPLIAKGQLIRYLQGIPSLTLADESSQSEPSDEVAISFDTLTPTGAGVFAEREAFERQLRARPKFWAAQLAELTPLLEADPLARPLADRARALSTKISFAADVAAKYHGMRVCQWFVAWGLRWVP